MDKDKNPVIPSGIYHRQKPLESTNKFNDHCNYNHVPEQNNKDRNVFLVPRGIHRESTVYCNECFSSFIAAEIPHYVAKSFFLHP
jgi:hypothetical protein